MSADNKNMNRIFTDTIQMKVVSSMEKVLPDREPSSDGMSLRLSGLKKETVSFQIAYFWNGVRKRRGQVKIEDIPGVKVTARAVGLVPCAYPCNMRKDDDYLSDKPGLYPDLLQDTEKFGFPLIAGQWRSLWIDLEITEEAAAGNYPLHITLEKAEQEEKIADVEKQLGEAILSLEVIGAVLPPMDIPYTNWFHCDCLANYYGVEVFSEEHWRIVENFVKTAVKRGMNMLLTPIFTPPLDTAVGGERTTVQLVDITKTADGYSFGFEKFDRWVKMALRCGIRYFEISHLFSQWGAVATPKIVATVNGREEKIFGWNTNACGEEYQVFLHAFLGALKVELEKLQIAENSYFHISDEPVLSQLPSYRAAKNVVLEDLAGYHMFDALSDYAFFKEGVIDEPVCSSDHIEPFLADRPKKLWTYYCTAQCVDVSNRFIVQPGYRTRILGTQLYKFAIDGFLQWGYNFYNSEYSLYPIDPYACTDADGAFPSGDPFVVYPGKGGVPEESQRIMLMDETFSDYRAMKLLESLRGREYVLSLLNEEKNGEITFKKYPRNAAYLTELRERINLAIKNA